MRERKKRAKTPIFEHTISPPQHKYLQFLSKIRRRKNVKPRQRIKKRKKETVAPF